MLIFYAIQYILKEFETNSKSVNTVVELPIGFAKTLPLWFIAYQDIP